MELPRLVMKFGGTSVGDAAAIATAGAIVLRARARRPAVVVSAAARVTDTLLALLGAATEGDASAPLRSLEERHRGLLGELKLSPALLDDPLAELRNLVQGVELLREVTPRTNDLVLSYGERLMAPLFAAYLSSLGLATRPWVAGEMGLLTDDRFTRARPLPEAYERIADALIASDPHVPVITGYLGRTRTGHTTTLGRGGSDYSASIVARAVGAEELQIGTDVDGILTADPRVVPKARLIERLAFQEASELAYSGAKVLHPSTIIPAMEGKIPVRVLNTHNTESPGTAIVDQADVSDDTPLRAIAHKFGVQVITVVSPRMLARHGFISRIASVFDRHQVSIDMISTSEVSVSFTTDDKPRDVGALLEELRSFTEVALEDDRGQVCVVGRGLGRDQNLVTDVLRTVTDSGAELEMITYGTTRTNLSFVTRNEHVSAVVKALHKRYFE